MSYELINNDLNIWSFSISDLTKEQVNCFLNQWSDGSKINSLVAFYEPIKDKIMINEDAKGLEQYLYIITEYFTLSYKQRVEYKSYLSEIEFRSEAVKKCIIEFLRILDSVISIRKIKEIDLILGKQPCQLDKVQEFEYIAKKYDGVYMPMINAYNYGYIEGIRAERAKRKAKAKQEVIVNA